MIMVKRGKLFAPTLSEYTGFNFVDGGYDEKEHSNVAISRSGKVEVHQYYNDDGDDSYMIGSVMLCRAEGGGTKKVLIDSGRKVGVEGLDRVKNLMRCLLAGNSDRHDVDKGNKPDEFYELTEEDF